MPIFHSPACVEDKLTKPPTIPWPSRLLLCVFHCSLSSTPACHDWAQRQRPQPHGPPASLTRTSHYTAFTHFKYMSFWANFPWICNLATFFSPPDVKHCMKNNEIQLLFYNPLFKLLNKDFFLPTSDHWIHLKSIWCFCSLLALILVNLFSEAWQC